MNGVIQEFAPPTRLYDYEMVCGAIENKPYPEEYEIPRDNTGTLKNQGTIGACVACVISQIAEALHKREFNSVEEISEGYTYGSLRAENSTSEGMIVSQALDYWRKLGVVPKKYFDILEEMPEMKKIVKKHPELLKVASKYKIGGYTSINYADNIRKDAAIKKALTETNYPLLAVADTYFREKHCIEIVGWNDKSDKYKIKNSWGTTWGDNGFGEIPKDEINAVYVIIPEEIVLPFTDVSEIDWFYKYVKNMYFNGMMSGTSDTTFEPNRPITRAEAATLTYNVLKLIDERFYIYNKVLNEKLK